MPTEDHQIKPLPSQRAIWTQVYLSQKSPVRCESYLLRGPSSWWYLKIQDLQFCFKTFPRVLMASPLQCSCLENPREQKSLAGHSPHVSRELDTTEQLSTVHSMDHLHQIISCLIKTQILRPPPQSWISMSPGVAWKNKFLIRNFRWFLCPRKPKIHCCASLWESGWLIH